MGNQKEQEKYPDGQFIGMFIGIGKAMLIEQNPFNFI